MTDKPLFTGWRRRARDWQSRVLEDEEARAWEYGKADINRSICKTREEMVLVVRYLEEVNERLDNNLPHCRFFLTVITVIMALGLWRIW